MSQYTVCQMQYAKNTRMSNCICILQYASQRAFLAILTHNPLRSGCMSKGVKVQCTMLCQSSMSQLYAYCMKQYVLCNGSCSTY